MTLDSPSDTPAGTDSTRSAALTLIVLALPIIANTLSRWLMGFIDFVMVSSLGTDAQAAISPVTLAVYVVFCLGMGTVSSVQTFSAQADGRGERREGSAYAWQSLYFSIGAAALMIPLSPIILWVYDAIARWATHAPEVRTQELAYLRIALWGFLPAAASSGLESFFNGVQKPRIALLAVGASLAALVAGNYALIFGHWGFPAMGIRGSAWATVGSWWIRALILFAAFVSPVFDDFLETRRAWRPDRAKLVGIVKLGAPMALHWLIEVSAWFMFLSAVTPLYGRAAMAATNVALQWLQLAFMPALGVGFALRSLVGFAVGEGRPERANGSVRAAMAINGVYMGAIGGLLILFGGFVMRQMNADPEVIALGRTILIWGAVFQVFDAMCLTYINALMGAGDSRWPALALAGCCWGIFIGGGLAVARLAPGLGVHGPWGMCAIYIFTLGLLLRRRFRSGDWRKIRLPVGGGA